MNFLKAIKYQGELLSQVQFFGTIDSEVSSSRKDLVELIITLRKDSDFPVLTTKVKLNNFKEVALRFEIPSLIGPSTKLFISDSMFFTERLYKHDYTVYPAVDGAAQARGDKVFWTINSHTMACQNIEKVYEYILHRSVDHKENKGIDKILNDTEISSVHIAMGRTSKENFIGKVRSADQVINQSIKLTKLLSKNISTKEFLEKHVTQLSFIRDNSFSEAIELVGLETKRNGDVFIKLRNRSNKAVTIPTSALHTFMFKINGDRKYLLNGLEKADEFFQYNKNYYPTQVGFRALMVIKDNIKTLESVLPDQKYKSSESVKSRMKGEREPIELEPFELVTFKIEQ